MSDYDLPPKDCQLQDRCLMLPLLRSGKMKKPIKGMERISPTCALCGAYQGRINDEEISELRDRLDNLEIKYWG